MPENLRTDVPDLIQAALYKTFPTLPAWEVATDGRDHRARTVRWVKIQAEEMKPKVPLSAHGSQPAFSSASLMLNFTPSNSLTLNQ